MTREEFNRVESERDYYQKKYSEERTEKLKLNRELDDFKSNSDEIVSEAKIDRLEIDVNENYVLNMLDKINTKERGNSLRILIGKINTKEAVDKIKSQISIDDLNFFLESNLIEIDNRKSYYVFTTFGVEVRDIFLRS